MRHVFLLACLFCSWTLASVGQAESWRRISDDDGVKVDVRDIAGQDFPEFRGIGVVHDNIYAVLAIIGDLERTCQWTARCVNSREVSRKTEFDRIFYSRTTAPWPVSDRDAALHAVLIGNLAEGKELTVKFDGVDTPLMPAQKGIVRMPQLNGWYRLQWLGAQETKVEFMVHADPGGMLPAWLVRSMSKGMPRDTLTGLRKQVVRMRGKYDDSIRRWSGAQDGAKSP